MKSKSLKKASAALLCAVIALMSAVTVFAAGQTYHIHEISDMAITLCSVSTTIPTSRILRTAISTFRV